MMVRSFLEPFLFEGVSASGPGTLFRVSRPGRAVCGSEGRVPDEVVAECVGNVGKRVQAACGLAEPIEIHYVCLLGRKPNGKREISGYYTAGGPDDGGKEPSFESLLNRLGEGKVLFHLHHFPTTDQSLVPEETLTAACTCIERLLRAGHVVLIGCSAAQGRTVKVLARLCSRTQRS